MDSGPLIALAKLNVLPLLVKLYGKVNIPEAVYKEAVIDGKSRGYTDARIIESFLAKRQWTPVKVDSNNLGGKLADLNIGPGEKACIALAMRTPEPLVLLDDEYARKACRERAIDVKGTLGVLVEAHRRHIIPFDDLDYYLNQIGNREDIWIHQDLCQKILLRLKDEKH